MAFGEQHECVACNIKDANMWRKNDAGEIVCNDCFLGIKRDDKVTADDSENGSNNGAGVGGRRGTGQQYTGPIRKSARLKPSKYRYQGSAHGSKQLGTKGKSRRVIFKKNPIKAPAAISTPVTCQYLFYKGSYYQVGDIVSVIDEDDNVYYAQVRGFLQDQYMNKSAIITWLLPTTTSPEEGFDPATYILGPEEDLPRKMEIFEFVCHAPSDYFKDKFSPYPTLPTKPEIGYVWSNIKTEIIHVPNNDELYGLKPLQPVEKGRGRKERESKSDKAKGEGRGRGAGRPPKEKEVKEIVRDKDKRTIIKKEKMSL